MDFIKFQLQDDFGLQDALISAQDDEFKTKYLNNFDETCLDYMKIEPTINQFNKPEKKQNKKADSILEFNLNKDIWISMKHEKRLAKKRMKQDQLSEHELCHGYMDNYLKLNFGIQTKQDEVLIYKCGYIVKRKCNNRNCKELFIMKFNLFSNRASLQQKAKCSHQLGPKKFEI